LIPICSTNFPALAGKLPAAGVAKAAHPVTPG